MMCDVSPSVKVRGSRLCVCVCVCVLCVVCVYVCMSEKVVLMYPDSY